MDLSGIPAVDQHAHNLVRSAIVAQTPYTAAFTEAYDPEILSNHARHTFCYRRSIREIAALLKCDPQEVAILAKRSETSLETLTQQCFGAANLKAILLDDGFLPDRILPLEWHQQFLPVHRLLRLERLAETLIPQVDRFDVFLEWFRSELDPPPPNVVGFKSVIAYRTGLDVEFVPPELAEERFYLLKRYAEEPLRLTDKLLLDFLLLIGLEIADRYQLPVQFHTGFGDPDLDLRLANPLHLRPLLESSRFRRVPFVLLHAAYPYMRELGYLAAVYPQVYLDFGLAVPFLSVAGMRQTVQQLLELSPTSKIMYSSDAHLIPELYYLGAKWGRETLAWTLEQAIHSSDLTASEAESIALQILANTAQTLYRLK